MTLVLDIILALSFFLTLLAGARQGFFRELFTLAGLVIGILLGMRLPTPILDRAPAFLRHSAAAWSVLFVAIFLAASLLIGTLGRTLASVWEGKERSGFSRFFGLILGGVRGLVLALFLAGAVVLLAREGSPVLGRSAVLPHLTPAVHTLSRWVLPPPSRQRLLERWERLPFPGKKAVPTDGSV